MTPVVHPAGPRGASIELRRCNQTEPYVHGCEHSYFRDLAEGNAATAETRKRLENVRILDERERRALTTGAGSGGAFVPAAGVPLYLAEHFAIAARPYAALLDALPQLPLPPTGTHIEVPRLTAGASAAVQAVENTTVSNTDPTTGLAVSHRAYLAGMVDISRQVVELSLPGIDRVLARDLGADLALRVDAQLVAGTNTSGQTEGLAAVVGINTVAYTDATPTAGKLVSKIWAAFQAIAEAGGGPPEPGPDNYVIAMAPRRLAFLSADAGQTTGAPVLPPLPGRAVATGGIRLTLGGGTNEDEIFVIARDQVFVCIDQPVIRLHQDPGTGSGTMTVRFSAIQEVAAMFSRQPTAVARISGTGLVAPAL